MQAAHVKRTERILYIFLYRRYRWYYVPMDESHQGGFKFNGAHQAVGFHIAKLHVHFRNMRAITVVHESHIPGDPLTCAWVILFWLSDKRSAGDIVNYLACFTELCFSAILFCRRPISLVRPIRGDVADSNRRPVLADERRNIWVQHELVIADVAAIDGDTGRRAQFAKLFRVDVEFLGLSRTGVDESEQ